MNIRLFSPSRLAACLAIICLSFPAAAASKQVMQYDVYAGGFHVLKSELQVDLSRPDRYALALDSATYGFLDKLVRWKGAFETDGWFNTGTGRARPQEHRSESTSGDDYEKKTYRYGKDGSFQSYSVKDKHNDGTQPKPVDPALTRRTTDALSATLQVMEAVARRQPCEGKEEVFDGSRRYRLVFHQKRETTLEASKYNVYSGPAVECTVEVQPLKGKWHQKPRGWMSIQEQGRKAGTMPTVWFASMKEGAPAVPVKIRVKTDYGTLFMHLTGYNNGQDRLQLAKP